MAAVRHQTWPRNNIIYRQPANINLTIDVGAMLDDLTVVFDSYTATVAGLTKANRVAQAARANMLAFRLLEIAGLADGRAEAIDVVLAFATNWSPTYRMLILVTVGVLVMVVVWLSFLTYRLSVVPLRRKLVESAITITIADAAELPFSADRHDYSAPKNTAPASAWRSPPESSPTTTASSNSKAALGMAPNSV